MADIASGVTDYSVFIISVIVGATVLVLVYISSLLQSTKEDDVKNAESDLPKKEKQKSVSSTNVKSKKKHSEKWVSRDTKQNFTHPWLLTSLKGHSGNILDMDFSSNGKFLATCAEDRTILVWSTNDWDQKSHKSLRINIDFDSARFIKWSPEYKAFMIYKSMEKEIEMHKIVRKAEGLSSSSSAVTFPKLHVDDVVCFEMASTGKFMMSCSEKNELIIWSLKGEQLAKVDTCLMSTISAHISPCARFFAASGFAPDVKVWEVKFSKQSNLLQVSRAFDLTGHSSGIYDISFSIDSSRMATVSKDGTWRAYNTQIEYEKGEDPHFLNSGKYNHTGNSPARITMSPNGEVVVVASDSSLAFYSVQTGECDNVIEDVYSGPIKCLMFESLGKFVLTGGEKHVRIFHNVTGYRTTIASIQARLRKTMTSAQKERMQQQLKEAELFLKKIVQSK